MRCTASMFRRDNPHVWHRMDNVFARAHTYSRGGTAPPITVEMYAERTAAAAADHWYSRNASRPFGTTMWLGHAHNEGCYTSIAVQRAIVHCPINLFFSLLLKWSRAFVISGRSIFVWRVSQTDHQGWYCILINYTNWLRGSVPETIIRDYVAVTSHVNGGGGEARAVIITWNSN